MSCSEGTLDKSNANFNTGVGQLPVDAYSKWKDGQSTYYDGNASAGDNTISVSNVKCGDESLSASCGTISLSKPTCTGVSGTKAVNETITPTVSCGNAEMKNPTFDCQGCSGWNGSGNGGYFSSTGNKTLNLTSVKCDDHSITLYNVSCGSVNVVSGDSPGGGGGGTTIDLSNLNSNGYDAGTYTVTTGGKTTCSVACKDGNACSLSGVISANCSNDCHSLGNLSVADGSVTITGAVVINSCW